MEIMQYIAGLMTQAILAAGPPFILGLWWFRTARPPGFAKFIVVSVASCAVAFWALFLLADHILELQFREVVPGDSWTPADETAWTDSQRRVVAAYFGDGGRNVFALFVPLPLLLYSTVLWAITRALHLAIRRRAI